MEEEMKKVLALVEENNKMLHGMRRSMRLSRFMTYIYWAVILGSAFLGYYLLQPYIDQATSLYTNTSGFIDKLK